VDNAGDFLLIAAMSEHLSLPTTLHSENPSALLEAHFGARPAAHAEAPAHNPALRVEAIGFVRYRGDWLGVLVTPWRLDLLLLAGGGDLWGDIPAGQRRYLDLYGATLPFVAVDEPRLGPYQYSSLVDQVGRIPDMAAAREIALDALHSYLPPQPPPVSPPIAPAESVSRRGFFRRLAGKH